VQGLALRNPSLVEEEAFRFDVAELPKLPTIPNLQWLIPAAIWWLRRPPGTPNRLIHFAE